MKFTPILLFFLLVIFGSCISDSETKMAKMKIIKPISIYKYEPVSIPVFISQLISNHTPDFAKIDSINYLKFCTFYQFKLKDSTNLNHYYTLKILHELFTCKSPINCSKGEILNIPYFWHHITPNPRYLIYSTGNGKLLKELKPPKEFLSCASYADIDRTPALFLCDLFEANPKYYTADCDTFSTFGWCSEREMAFIYLLDLLHFKGKTVARGGHAWSELIVPFNTTDNKTIHLNIKIDNTFDTVEPRFIKEDEFAEWEKYLGNTLECMWYNEMAHSKAEQQKVSTFLVSPKASSRMEESVVQYIRITQNRID